MNEPAVELKNVTRTFGERAAVSQLSFQVSPGEIFGFLGPNGAGKSTTVRLLLGTLRADEGELRVLGYDPRSHGPSLRAKLGVMLDRPGHYERLSSLSNLKFFARLYGADEARCQELLQRVGLAERAKEPVGHLSLGLKKRLALARALLGRPQMLILDEPTSGLDPIAGKRFRRLIKEFSTAGGTVFLTTHLMEEAEQLCDRIAIIESGGLLCCDTVEALKQRYLDGEGRLEDVFVQVAGRSMEEEAEI